MQLKQLENIYKINYLQKRRQVKTGRENMKNMTIRQFLAHILHTALKALFFYNNLFVSLMVNGVSLPFRNRLLLEEFQQRQRFV